MSRLELIAATDLAITRHGYLPIERMAVAVLDAVEPIIRAAISDEMTERSAIAGALLDATADRYYEGARDAYEIAERIARGTA